MSIPQGQSPGVKAGPSIYLIEELPTGNFYAVDAAKMDLAQQDIVVDEKAYDEESSFLNAARLGY